MVVIVDLVVDVVDRPELDYVNDQVNEYDRASGIADKFRCLKTRICFTLAGVTTKEHAPSPARSEGPRSSPKREPTN